MLLQQQQQGIWANIIKLSDISIKIHGNWGTAWKHSCKDHSHIPGIQPQNAFYKSVGII